MNNLVAKIKAWSNRKKILVSVLVVLLLGAGSYLLFTSKGNSALTLLTTGSSRLNKQEPKDTPSPINGVFYTKTEAKSWSKRVPLAVVVENHLDARPQSGLARADLIYEYLAEGGITRFLAIFQTRDTEIGPVRSARPYQLDWLSEYGAVFAHWGGSPEALDLISQNGITDLDGIYLEGTYLQGSSDKVFYRVSDREEPHNGYTKASNLWRAVTERGWNNPMPISAWKFKDDSSTPSTSAHYIKIRFSDQTDYDVEWQFDSSKNLYLRKNGGQVEIDKVTNEQLSAKNIVVEYVDTSFQGGEGRLHMDTIGSGEAKIFQDGGVIQGTWKKDKRTSRTHFYDKNDNEVSLNRGQIWIEVLPSGQGDLKGGGIEYSS